MEYWIVVTNGALVRAGTTCLPVGYAVFESHFANKRRPDSPRCVITTRSPDPYCTAPSKATNTVKLNVPLDLGSFFTEDPALPL